MATFRTADGTALTYHQFGDRGLVGLPGGPMQASAWDAAARAHKAAEAGQRNAEAAAVYYADGALDPSSTRTALGDLAAPVLLLAGEYDMALPPKNAAEYAALFPHAELAVQPRAGHFPWLDDRSWFTRTIAAFVP